MMMGRRLIGQITTTIFLLSIFGCTVYQKPRPIHDVPFMERSQSKIDGDVRVTVAVLGAEESRQLFGVNLAGQDIQPVWVRVQNAYTIGYWLMSSGLDPDYFSPLVSLPLKPPMLFIPALEVLVTKR